EIFSLFYRRSGAGGLSVLAVAKDGSRSRSDRPVRTELAATGRYPAEASSGNFFANARDAAAGRPAAGTVHGDGGHFDEQPAHPEGCDAGEHESSRRAGARQQPGGTEYFSGPRGGDARGWRIHGSITGDVEFGC